MVQLSSGTLTAFKNSSRESTHRVTQVQRCEVLGDAHYVTVTFKDGESMQLYAEDRNVTRQFAHHLNRAMQGAEPQAPAPKQRKQEAAPAPLQRSSSQHTKGRALHLMLSPTVGAEVDRLLFQLLVLQDLTDADGQHYSVRPQESHLAPRPAPRPAPSRSHLGPI